MSPSIIVLPRHGHRYTVDTDACGSQIGCAPLQQQLNGDNLPIASWSVVLSAPKMNYSTTEKKCLAAVWIVLILRPYLYWNTSKYPSDHHALKWVLNLADSSGRLARCRLQLPKHEYEVEYRPGATHKLADGVSCLQRSEERQDVINDKVPCLVTEGISSGDAAQSENRETVIAF